MLIDQFLPNYEVSARYETVIHAPPERVFQAACSLDARVMLAVMLRMSDGMRDAMWHRVLGRRA